SKVVKRFFLVFIFLKYGPVHSYCRGRWYDHHTTLVHQRWNVIVRNAIRCEAGRRWKRTTSRNKKRVAGIVMSSQLVPPRCVHVDLGISRIKPDSKGRHA